MDTPLAGSPLGGYSPDWKCLQCDNINFARRTECKQCGAPRTASSPATHVSQQYAPDWRCTSCGNINFARRTECKQCSKPRTADAQPAFAPNHAALKASQQIRGYGGPKTVIMGPGDWTCPSCGFMNFARYTPQSHASEVGVVWQGVRPPIGCQRIRKTAAPAYLGR